MEQATCMRDAVGLIGDVLEVYWREDYLTGVGKPAVHIGNYVGDLCEYDDDVVIITNTALTHSSERFNRKNGLKRTIRREQIYLINNITQERIWRKNAE